MTFRLRKAQQEALTQSHVGNFLADLARPVAKAAYYDSLQQCLCIIGTRNRKTRIRLDSQGKLLQLVTPLKRELRFQYERGKQVGAQLPTGLAIRTQYDAQGRVVAESRSDGAWHQLGYDAHDNLAALRCADGSTLLLTYRVDGRLERVIERDGGEVRRAYDERGRLARVVNPLGRETRFAYDLWSEPVRIHTPDGHAVEYVYRYKEAQERVDGADHAEYAFDENGRLAGATYADGYELKLKYDQGGQLTSATSPDAHVSYEYDGAGRVIADAQDGRTVRFAYDEDGQLSAIKLPDGRDIAYHYDLDGRLASVRDWSGATQRFHYGAGEFPVHRELPNGLVETYQLDLAGRIMAADLHNRCDVFWSQRYERDALGRVIAQADSRTGRRRLRYDACSRLREVIDEATGAPIEWYAYDTASQRIQSATGFTRFDAMSRPVQDGDAAFNYDALGNRVEKADGARTTRYSWRGPNLLCAVDLPDGLVARYYYDALGRRVRKEIGETQVTFVWAGHHLVQELHETPAGSHTVEYLYFPGGHQLLAKCEAGQTYYYHCDQLGTPQLLTDRAARLVWSARYDIFGTAKMEHDFVAQPWRLPGQYWDAETDLHYNRARYYDPELGVYLSRDPLSPAGENAYLYVGANPVNAADPLGLFWDDAPGWVKTTATMGAGIVVGLAAGAAVIAVAPAIGLASTTAGAIALLAGGAMGGAAAGGLGAAMTESGCVPCGMLKGSAVGLVAALPFAFLPTTAGIATFTGVGMASGAVGYFADLGLSGGQFNWNDFGKAVVLGGMFGGSGRYIAGKFAKGKGPGGTPEDAPNASAAAEEHPPVSLGLGPEVDDLANMSATMKKDFADLEAGGWTFQQGTSGNGSSADLSGRVIRIDPMHSSSPERVVQTLAHEFGHATGPEAPYAIPGPSGYPNKQAFVEDVATRMLDHEGYATLKNAQIRQDILDAGGPDIGIAGKPQNTSAYENISQQVRDGRLTPEQGARQIGRIFRSAESPSTNPSETYGSNLEKVLSDYYDSVISQNGTSQ